MPNTIHWDTLKIGLWTYLVGLDHSTHQQFRQGTCNVRLDHTTVQDSTELGLEADFVEDMWAYPLVRQFQLVCFELGW